ncbi:MAG: rod shape-determining protein MreC [Patescibacteria group bacterium]
MSRVIPNLQLFLSLLFLSLIILLLDNFHFLDFAKRASFYITNPISFGIYKNYQNLSRQLYFIYAARLSAQENRALKEQIGELFAENAKLRQHLAELEVQVSQKDFLDPKTYNLIAARPIGLLRYLKIDKGEDDGVKVGEAVVFKDNFIGRIVATSPKSANIQVLADPQSKVAAFSQGTSGRAKGVLLGQFGTELLMDKILHEEKISKGDLVYSEGTEGFLPRGLILGEVTEVRQLADELFKQAKIEQVFDIRDLELVFVIKE